MLFRWEKHGAPVRRDFSHMMQKGRGRIGFCHGRCFRAQFALKGAHASPSLLAHAAGRSRGPAKNAPRGFLPSHGLPPTMAAFRRKAAQLQIQLRGKPRILTGFLLSARHALQRRAEDDTMYSSCLQSDFFIAYFAAIVNTHPKFVAVPAPTTNFFIFCAPGIDICNFPAII